MIYSIFTFSISNYDLTLGSCTSISNPAGLVLTGNKISIDELETQQRFRKFDEIQLKQRGYLKFFSIFDYDLLRESLCLLSRASGRWVVARFWLLRIISIQFCKTKYK